MALSLMELVAQKKKQLSSGNRKKTIKPAEGRNRYRILPSWRKEGGQFWHDFGQHFIKDAAGQIKAVYVCVDRTFGKPCQVCDALSHAIKTTADDAMAELLKEAKASGRVLVNALQVEGQNPNEPEILELAPGTFEAVLGIMSEWGPDEVLSLTNGMDIIIERTGKGINTKYSVQVAAKSRPVDPSVMSKITNLDEYAAQESAEQQARALSNLSAVAGLLPSGSTAAAPAAGAAGIAAAMSVDDADAALEALEGSATRVAPSAGVQTPAEAGPVPTPPATPAAPASTGDAELDDLLAELG